MLTVIIPGRMAPGRRRRLRRVDREGLGVGGDALGRTKSGVDGSLAFTSMTISNTIPAFHSFELHSAAGKRLRRQKVTVWGTGFY